MHTVEGGELGEVAENSLTSIATTPRGHPYPVLPRGEGLLVLGAGEKKGRAVSLRAVDDDGEGSELAVTGD